MAAKAQRRGHGLQTRDPLSLRASSAVSEGADVIRDHRPGLHALGPPELHGLAKHLGLGADIKPI